MSSFYCDEKVAVCICDKPESRFLSGDRTEARSWLQAVRLTAD